MKIERKKILVVEGKSDKAFLENFINCEIVITNGSSVPRETIEYLKNASLSADIVVLTDPDSPGKRIRNILDKEIKNVFHAYIDKQYCIKKNKVGIAESDKEHVIESLNNLLISGQDLPTQEWSLIDLYKLGISGNEDSKIRRRAIEKEFHLGHNNTKSLCNRLNARGVSKIEVEEFLRKNELFEGEHK